MTSVGTEARPAMLDLFRLDGRVALVVDQLPVGHGHLGGPDAGVDTGGDEAVRADQDRAARSDAKCLAEAAVGVGEVLGLAQQRGLAAGDVGDLLLQPLALGVPVGGGAVVIAGRRTGSECR